jgi:hypothetical protein
MSLGLSFSAHSGYFASIDLEINSIKLNVLNIVSINAWN